MRSGTLPHHKSTRAADIAHVYVSDSWRQHLAEVSIELVFGNVASREVATAKAASYSDSSECQVAIFFSFRLWTFALFEKYGDDRGHISDLIVLHLYWPKR